MEERVKYLKAFVVYVFRRFSQDRCSSIAAELTITSLLALVPLSAVIFALLGFIPSFQELGEQLQSLVFKYFVPGTGETVKSYINEFVGKAKGLSGIGSMMLLITALLMMRTIDNSFNKIWRSQYSKSVLRTFLVYWAVLSLGPLLLGSSLLITSYLKSLPVISQMVADHDQWFVFWLPFAMELLAFSLLYLLIPNRKIVMWHALLSGLLTACLFEFAKYGFGVFVKSFSTYQLIFGALATVPLFLIWIYLSWGLMLFGAEVCHALEAFELEREKAWEHPFIEVVSLILMLSQYQQQGKTLDEKTLKRLSRPGKREANLSWLEKLVDAELVAKTEDQAYCLLKSADCIDFLSIYQVAGNQFPQLEQVEASSLPTTLKTELSRFSHNMAKMLSGHLVTLCRPATTVPTDHH